jgi:hypothetical protein
MNIIKFLTGFRNLALCDLKIVSDPYPASQNPEGPKICVFFSGAKRKA